MVGLVPKKRMVVQRFPLGPVVSAKGVNVLAAGYEDFSGSGFRLTAGRSRTQELRFPTACPSIRCRRTVRAQRIGPAPDRPAAASE
jgi:hypothetical protein